jgi:hypothetical protein
VCETRVGRWQDGTDPVHSLTTTRRARENRTRRARGERERRETERGGRQREEREKRERREGGKEREGKGERQREEEREEWDGPHPLADDDVHLLRQLHLLGPPVQHAHHVPQPVGLPGLIHTLSHIIKRIRS